MAHLFLNFQNFVGTAACAYDRTAMLAGKSNPVQVCFTIQNDGGFQPSDLDGSTAPPDGSPGYFITFETTSLHQFQLAPNFANPSASTFTGPINIPVSTFSPACGGTGGTCVPQKGTFQQLDSLGDRIRAGMKFGLPTIRRLSSSRELTLPTPLSDGWAAWPWIKRAICC
jgi:hypothetical protein